MRNILCLTILLAICSFSLASNEATSSPFSTISFKPLTTQSTPTALSFQTAVHLLITDTERPEATPVALSADRLYQIAWNLFLETHQLDGSPYGEEYHRVGEQETVTAYLTMAGQPLAMPQKTAPYISITMTAELISTSWGFMAWKTQALDVTIHFSETDTTKLYFGQHGVGYLHVSIMALTGRWRIMVLQATNYHLVEDGNKRMSAFYSTYITQ